jgi:hypothetical protein
MMERSRAIGLPAGQWAEQMLQNRDIQGIRVLQGFLRLTEDYAPKFINDACLAAMTHGAWHLSQIKALLDRPSIQNQFEFLCEHPIIRDLSSYQELTPDCFSENNTNPNSDEPTTHESNA